MSVEALTQVTPVATVPVMARPVSLPRPLRVAVCDDDVRFIRMVERLLAEAHAAIVPVTTLDPNDAVRVVMEAACDAALIDLNIYNDGQAGLTLVRLLRECPATAGMSLFLVTAASPRDVKRHEALLRESRCGVLPKPFSAEELFAALGLSVSGVPAA
jgi:CheY-like chemotaxis protein